jgi:hypothetical protein
MANFCDMQGNAIKQQQRRATANIWAMRRNWTGQYKVSCVLGQTYHELR